MHSVMPNRHRVAELLLFAMILQRLSSSNPPLPPAFYALPETWDPSPSSESAAVRGHYGGLKGGPKADTGGKAEMCGRYQASE